MINKVFLLGRLGTNPELKYTASGKPITTFMLATNEIFINNGEKKEHTEWHKIVCFGRLAELCFDYLQKGELIFVEGKIRTKKYTDQAEIERIEYKIYADKIEFLGKKAKEKENIKQSQENIGIDPEILQIL